MSGVGLEGDKEEVKELVKPDGDEALALARSLMLLRFVM
jgi:hypothetical protein